jgi:hypothetical protein
MKGAFREAQARVGLLDRCTDLCSLADIAAGMATGLPNGLTARNRGRCSPVVRREHSMDLAAAVNFG